jgi:hypothetical protein
MSPLVGLPGADDPPHREPFRLQPTSISTRFDSAEFHVTWFTWLGLLEKISVSGARVPLPPSIHPSGLSRHLPVVPIQVDPLQLL